MSAHTPVVQDFFAALGRGELEALIEMVAEDVDWHSPVTRTHPPEIPWSSIRRSREEVAAFLNELGSIVRPEGFVVHQMTAQDDRVVVEGTNRGTVRDTGRAYEHDWVMLFTVRDEKIVRFRHYYDTADLVGALRPD